MDSIRIRVDQIFDFTNIVTVIGTDLGSNRPLAIHVDHKPFQTLWELWRLVDLPQPVAFDGDRLILALDFTDEPDGQPSGCNPNQAAGRDQC